MDICCIRCWRPGYNLTHSKLPGHKSGFGKSREEFENRLTCNKNPFQFVKGVCSSSATKGQQSGMKPAPALDCSMKKGNKRTGKHSYEWDDPSFFCFSSVSKYCFHPIYQIPSRTLIL
jgi:hypothetical protein